MTIITSQALSKIFEGVERNKCHYNFEATIKGSNTPVNIYVNFDPHHRDGIYHISVGSYHGDDDQGQGFSEGKISVDRDLFIEAVSCAKGLSSRYGEVTSLRFITDEHKNLDIPLNVKALDLKLQGA